MKLYSTLFILFGFLLGPISSHSQDVSSTVIGGQYKFNENKTECLTTEQRKEVLTEIKSNLTMLKSQKRLAYDGAQKRAPTTLFSWPVKMKEGAPYQSIWAISNYVDQNAEYPNKLLDYNCGTRTYDTNAGYNHKGVDIFTWPFPWKMMDNDEAEIVAAAPGQIISISRTNFDRNCAMNSLAWNAVYVQHTDGSVAVYGHMKKDSPTPKNVGDTVEEGEYLGIIGSSGSSTGPHLHFEVYSEIEWNGVGQDVLIDPYAGDCNSLNTDSWWKEQKPYVNPNINAVFTHSADPIFPTCPTQEVMNEKNDFAPGETVYLGVYLRDQIAGTKINLSVIAPNGTIYNNWEYNLADNYQSSYWYWYIVLPSTQGEWTWRASYQGQVVDHKFMVETLGVEDHEFNAISIYPNPFNDVVNIQSNSLIKKASVANILGKTVMVKTNATESIKEINLESLPGGVYFLKLEGINNQQKTIKLIKE